MSKFGLSELEVLRNGCPFRTIYGYNGWIFDPSVSLYRIPGKFSVKVEEPLNSAVRCEACPLLWVQVEWHQRRFSFTCLSLFFSFPHKGVRAGLSCSGWREVCVMVINSMHEFLTACSSSLWSRYVFESGQRGMPLEITVKHSKKLLLICFWGKLLWIGCSIWLVIQLLFYVLMCLTAVLLICLQNSVILKARMHLVLTSNLRNVSDWGQVSL